MGNSGSIASQGRGRKAARPGEIPTPGWRDVALRVKDQLSKDNISLVAAGVAFYSVLALFPALAALISIYGLVAEPGQVQEHMDSLSALLPREAYSIIREQFVALASDRGSELNFGVLGGLLLALWSASAGMKALITSLNIAYDEEERRGFLRFTGLALGLTVGAIVFIILALGLITVLPSLLDVMGLGQFGRGFFSLARWPLLACFVLVGLSMLYHFAPCRDPARWQWVSWGAGIATLLWTLGSIAFSIYVDHFGNYNKMYGSLGAVVALFMWFFVTGFIVMLGAEINSELERQTTKDTTVGPSQPMGQRDAHAADTLGKVP